MFKNIFSTTKAIADLTAENAKSNPNKNLITMIYIKIFVLGFIKGFARVFLIGMAVIAFVYALLFGIARFIGKR